MSIDLPKKNEEFHDYVTFTDVRVPMRDGVKLSNYITFPSTNGVVDFNKKYPVILIRSPYMYPHEMLYKSKNITSPLYMEHYLTDNGYVLIVNIARGTYLSEGILEPMVNEGWGEKQDGVDMVAWIMKQSWCNGKIATTGISYLGGVQYALQLAGDVPGLETSAIFCPAMNSADGGWVYAGEFLDTSCAALWAFQVADGQCKYKKLPKKTIEAIVQENEELGDPFGNPERFNLYKLHSQYSLREIPIARHMPFYQKWLDNRDNPDFFSYNDTRMRKHDVKKPLLFIGGWYDLFNLNVLNGYRKMLTDAPTEEVAKAHRLIIGPWNHIYNPLVREFPEGESDARLFVMEWFEQQLKGKTSQFFQNNPVSIFVMGENRWRSESSWPLKDTVQTSFYIHSDGNANGLYGDGVLSAEIPVENETPDVYMSDPANPVASPGGHGVAFGGQADQRPAENRPDVLVYTSERLKEDIEVTGYVRAYLYAATSATDTDFIMKLIDVTPDGCAYNVVTGGRRGRYLKKGRTKPEALTPNRIEQYEMELRATSYVFKKGHRIRVDITSSDCLNTDINPNAFIDLNSATNEDYVVAKQTIYHDTARPTRIELPVIPVGHERKWIDEWPFRAELTGISHITSDTYNIPPAMYPPNEKNGECLSTNNGSN